MKKIVFVVYSLNIGGVERALLGMLSKLDNEEYEVYLKVVNKKGGFLSSVSPKVRIDIIEGYHDNWILLNKPLPELIISSLKRLKIVKALKLARMWVNTKITGIYHSVFEEALKYDKDDNEYDVAVSYAGPTSMLDYYVAYHLKAKRKIGWVHYDVEKFSINRKSQNICYKCFDNIFVVSKEGKIKFDNLFPQYKNKTQVLHNIINASEILEQSKIPVDILPSGYVNIVTVGRLSHEKGQDIAIQSLYYIKKAGYEVMWTFVGGGLYASDLEEMAKYYDVRDRIVFAGETKNPYPYMAQCDIYVQPSKHEGYCITLKEARILGRPIVATDFTGAKEQLMGYEDSIITHLCPEELADAIISIIENSKGNNAGVTNMKADYSDDFKLFRELL